MIKRRNTQTTILIILSVLILVGLMVVAAMVADILRREDEVVTTGAQMQEVYYTQEEMDEILARTRAEAAEEAELAAVAKAEEILGGIQTSLESGNSYVETLRPYYPDKLVLASNGRLYFLPIQEALAKNDYVQENLQMITAEDGSLREYQYMKEAQVISHKGIDVSKFQGDIDWEAVAADGVEFAFIRVALRGYGTGKLLEDEYFEQNIKGANAAGIKTGVYVFSQAITEEELLEEAELVLELIAPYKIECPVVFDVEKIAGDDGRMNDISVEERTKLTLLFCQTIEAAGYKPMIYHNMEMAGLMLDLTALEAYDKWFAYYNDDLYYPYAYKVWQYSEKGKVAGIDTEVDMNISFEPLWE